VLRVDTHDLGGSVKHADVAGDVNGDGVDDLVTSKASILFMAANGQIASEAGTGAGGYYPCSATGLGDLDQDGVPDVAIGRGDGCFRVLFLNPNGTAKRHVEHSVPYYYHTNCVDAFDLDGDGRKELTVSTMGATTPVKLTTAFLNPDGSIAHRGVIDVPGDIPPCVYWGTRIDYYSDGRLAASGGGFVDWVTIIPESVPASSTFRNAGANLPTYGCVRPVLGDNRLLSVDTATTGHVGAFVIGLDSAIQHTLPGGQTLLCADLLGSGLLLHTGFHAGPTTRIGITFPRKLELIGFSLSTQAVSMLGATPFALSNACDWVLGFE